MPRSLEPGTRLPIVLDADVGKDPCPTFYAKSLSVRMFREGVGALQTIQSATDKAEVMFSAFSTLRPAIVGWSGMIDPDTGREIEYDPERLDDLLDIEEAMELIRKIMESGRLSVDDRKKSGSPPLSSAANCANRVASNVAEMSIR